MSGQLHNAESGIGHRNLGTILECSVWGTRGDAEDAVTTLEVALGHAGEGSPLLSLRGELDLSTAPKVEQALRQLEGDGPSTIVIDLRGLTFLDSSGLRLILEADSRARREDRRLLVVPGPPEVQRVFRVTLTDARIEFIENPSVIETTDGGSGA